MYRQTEDQVQWGQGLPQAQQPPRGGQQWQQSPMHGGQQTPQYYQQNAPGQQYGPPASQGGEQWQGAAWSGQPQGTPYQQGSPAYGAGPPAGQGESAWRGGAQPQQGGQGWQSATQGQHPGQAAPQQQQQAASPMENVRSWLGTVTQLIPPNYGIVDGNAFYIDAVVEGKLPAVGDKVACEGTPNIDGGMYEWRLHRVQLAHSATVPMPQPQQTRPFAIPHNRPPASRGREAPSQAQASPLRSPAHAASPAHQQNIVPTKPLGGFKSSTKPEDKPVEPAKYNQMAPPMTAYTAEYALAKASAAMEGSYQQANVAQPQDRRAFFVNPAKQLDDEAMKKSAAAAQQLGSIIGDPASIGAKLMSKMGFGVAGQGLGRAGQGIVAPVEAVKMGQGQGLGFERERKERPRSPEHDRPARRRGPREDRARPRTPPRRRPASRSRSRSPGSDARGRYRVEPPKFPPADPTRGVATLSKRYRNLYIPADFCHVSASWVVTLPDWDALPLTHHVSMRIAKAEKEAEERASEAPEDRKEDAAEDGPSLASDVLTPGRRWGARVVLMSGANARLLNNPSVKIWQHPMKKLQFLVGQRGRRETMLIGGAWDPVDGADPAHSPATLKATAIRTFLAATGVDLSPAAHWTSFAQLHYLRKNGYEDDIEEDVMVFVVDAHELAVPDQEAKDLLAKAASAATTEIEAKKALDAAEEEERSAEASFELLGREDVPAPPDMGDNLTLAPAEMTVAALQEALSKRGLDTKWNPLSANKKKELVDRLQDYLSAKRAEHAALDKDYRAFTDAKKAVETAKERTKEVKETVKNARAAVREALKTVSDPPAVEMVHIHPNQEFLGSKESFRVDVASLDALLAYTEKDDRESTFEVSVFAELFREMLEAKFGRGILRTLELLERQDRQARARKAEERKAKKGAEAAAKAKAKVSGESASAENAPQDANKAAAPDAAVDTAVKMDSEGVGKGEEGALSEARKEGDNMVVDGTLASLKAVEAEAGLPIKAPATANGDIEMAGAKQEAGAVLSMAADANVMPNGDTPAAPAAADNLGQADVAAKCVAAAPQETGVKASEAPVKVEEPAAAPEAAGGETEALKIREEASKKGREIEAAPEHSKDAEGRKQKEPKKASKDAKDVKDRRAPSKDKKDDDRKRKEDKSKDDTRDKGRSRDDKGRSSKEDLPSRHTRSGREKDSASKRKDNSSKKSDGKAADDNHRRKPSDKAKAEDDKEGRKGVASPKEAVSKKRTTSEGHEPDAKQAHKKPKMEKEAEAELITANAPPPKTGEHATATAAAPMAEASTAAHSQLDAAAPAAQPVAQPATAPPAVAPAPEAAAPALPAQALQALPPPEPRWPVQTTPLFLACRYFDRDLAGYIEAADLEEILVMVSNGVSRRRLQNLVDTVSKRSKMSYMETHASLEVPAVAPPQHMWPGGTGAIHSSLAALADTPLQHFQPAPFVVSGKTPQGSAAEAAIMRAKAVELAALHTRLTALAKSEAELKKAVSAAKGEKAALEGEKAALTKAKIVLEKEKAALEKEKAALTGELDTAQKDAEQSAVALAAKHKQAAADVSKTLEEIAATEQGLLAIKQKLAALSSDLTA